MTTTVMWSLLTWWWPLQWSQHDVVRLVLVDDVHGTLESWWWSHVFDVDVVEPMHLMMALGPWLELTWYALMTWCTLMEMTLPCSLDGDDMHWCDGCLMSFDHVEDDMIRWYDGMTYIMEICSCLWWGILYPFIHLPCASPTYSCKPLQDPHTPILNPKHTFIHPSLHPTLPHNLALYTILHLLLPKPCLNTTLPYFLT